MPFLSNIRYQQLESDKNEIYLLLYTDFPLGLKHYSTVVPPIISLIHGQYLPSIWAPDYYPNLL
jgi:hypothetical protein